MIVLDAIAAYLTRHGVAVIKTRNNLRIHVGTTPAPYDKVTPYYNCISIYHPMTKAAPNHLWRIGDNRDMSIITIWDLVAIDIDIPIADPELMEKIIAVVNDADGQVSSGAS